MNEPYNFDKGVKWWTIIWRVGSRFDKSDMGGGIYCIEFWFDELECEPPLNTVPDDLDNWASGVIKWNGCADWDLPQSYHTCNRDMLNQLTLVMQRCWDIANEQIGIAK